MNRETIQELAAACARTLPAAGGPLEAGSAAFDRGLTALVAAIRASHERFAFDAEGRPGAIAAIRQALPVIEAELLDAVLEDVACELAARQEAIYQVALAARTIADG
jgi:hypothetical protein